PEERKLQRLFRTPEACRLIKRCNDFGAGGVSVAIGELADGLEIDLNAVPRKYDGLDGTELAISESQERMAVVVEAKDVERFMELAYQENLEATVVAKVTEEPRMVMHWNGRTICNISREFLNSNGAEKHIDIKVARGSMAEKAVPACFAEGMKALAGDLNVCSKRGLSERFDSTIGAGSVLMPFGGKRQLTPSQAMINKVSVEHGDTQNCSYMAWGYNPYVMEKSPYHGAYLAVVESASKLIASGASTADTYLTFQEYFEKPMKAAERWGKPLSALLGALRAQKDLGIAAIGGKDSMSGSFEKLDVPPTLVSFAVTTGTIPEVVSPEFKRAGSTVCLVKPVTAPDGLPDASSLKGVFEQVHGLMAEGKVLAAWTPGFGGIAEGVMKMSMGNGLGFEYAEGLDLETVFGYNYGSFILEMAEGTVGTVIGKTTAEDAFVFGEEKISRSEIESIYENKLESVYSCNIKTDAKPVESFSFEAKERVAPAIKVAKPRVLIPVFPGTNCEYDSAKAAEAGGLEAEIYVINNLSAEAVARSVDEFAKKLSQSQIVFIPGGFSGGDEPDGSAKFITSFFRALPVKEQVGELMDNRGGLMLGICNGFQALVKLGLVPYGKITEPDPNAPTLTFNVINRHQSRLVRTRIASNKSPWLANTNVGEVYTVPISHGEGRFYTDEATALALAANGQIATQYVDENGAPTMDIRCNPNGSIMAIEGITSPDGRVLGKMGHSERIGKGLYKNVDGEYNMKLFQSAKEYFR
ncbi:MAG: phosphoribosylformylglycinamidine synthase, partial [Clostridia bacterium]|nr:phosphoribosylformylglycinamidine synthase [Clostridia bacterium]